MIEVGGVDRSLDTMRLSKGNEYNNSHLDIVNKIDQNNNDNR